MSIAETNFTIKQENEAPNQGNTEFIEAVVVVAAVPVGIFAIVDLVVVVGRILGFFIVNNATFFGI